jgi:hypothetical protein
MMDEYQHRITELQAKYRLVPMQGPIFRANELVATFFETDPPTLMTERGDSTSLMFSSRAAAVRSIRDETRCSGSIRAQQP